MNFSDSARSGRHTAAVGVTPATCADCGTSNPNAARFCIGCGAARPLTCGACGAVSPPEARFCMTCGAALAGVPADASASTRPGEEERRLVSVLFADLSGYTAVAERMDPEAVREISDRCLRRLTREVTGNGGRVDKYMGDNIMAVFGAPLAHEDDAERAVRAGLAMQAAMSEINDDLHHRYQVRFELRVGVNTGEVLAGGLVETYTVMGDAVNVASRLQEAGKPGTVTVGELTWRATRHCVDYGPLEPLLLKGKADPVAAWQAQDLRRQSAPRITWPNAAPLVGRADELARLEARYRQVVSEGRTHLVTLVGEAGVGKSRLLRELAAGLRAGDPVPTLRQGRCLAYGSGTVYWPLGEVLRAECQIDDDDTAELAWAKLSECVGTLIRQAHPDDEAAALAVTLIGRLLGIEAPHATQDPTAELDAGLLRESFFASVRTVVEGMARERPLLLVFEDIHWADQGMLDLVEHLSQWVRAQVLIVSLARGELLERRPSWGSGRRASTLVLEPLSIAETGELVQALLPGTSGRTAAREVAERSGGNPFFAEEMARRLADERDTSVADLPATVHALLAARLDRLTAVERRLLQRAAVVGRTFWPDTLARLAAAEGADLHAVLDALRDKDMIVPGEGRRLAGEPELAFKHALLRDVAYARLPKAARARAHHEIGAFIQERAGDRAEEVVTLLAEHYARAASLGAEAQLDPDELRPMRAAALTFLEAAGDAAAQFFSNEEALAHFDAARALAQTEPLILARVADKQGHVALRLGRIQEALDLWRSCLTHHLETQDQELIGATLRKIAAALAHSGERRSAIEHLQQGMTLLKSGAPTVELVHLYEDAAWLYVQSGDNMLAVYASEKALRLAEQIGGTTSVSRAHVVFGRVFSRIGDLDSARVSLQGAVEIARCEGALQTVLALIALGNHLEVAEADYPAAREAYGEGLGVAKRIGDVPCQVELHAVLAQLAVYRADWEAVESLSDASRKLAERDGLVLKLCLPYTLRGLLLWRTGEHDAAVERYRRAAELAEEVGWSEVAYGALYGLATVLRDDADHDGAVRALQRAVDIAERAGLVVQAVQGEAARAVVLALANRRDEGRRAAERAAELHHRLRSPVGCLSVLEAQGANSADGTEGATRLRGAAEGWTDLGRPLDAARCRLLAGRALDADDPGAATEEYLIAAAEFDRLGVPHLAERARLSVAR